MRKKNFPSKEEVLRILKSGVLLSVVFLFPGAAKGLAKLMGPWQEFSAPYLRRKIRELKKERLVSFKEKRGKLYVKITKEGEEKIKQFDFENPRIEKPKKWDGKWRVVIFDIPNDCKKAREVFREKLRIIGMYPLQESVFIYPYPCFSEINILREMCGISPFVKFLLVEGVEGEKKLIENFQS